MRLALKEAEKAALIDEVPVGAVIVRDGKVMARAHNLKEQKNQAYAHAELLAIQKASKKLGTWCLDDCDLYVTLEPCLMCIGAIGLSRIHTLYYGTQDPKGGAVESVLCVKTLRHIGTYPRTVVSGVLKEPCSAVLSDFFKKKREQKKQRKSAES